MYQTASMGSRSINQVLSKVTDPQLKSELNRQMNTYRNETNTVVDRMREEHLSPQQLPLAARAMSSMGIAFNLARDNSTEHIAEMMIKGTNMGVLKLNKALNAASDLSPELERSAKEMLDREQKYIDRMKKFL